MSKSKGTKRTTFGKGTFTVPTVDPAIEARKMEALRARLDLQDAVEAAFDRDLLAKICEMPEADFAAAYGLDTYEVSSHRRTHGVDDFYYFKDNGSDILAVAHLDTVGLAHERACHFLDTEAGEVVYSRALDDRLGAYIILELLPALGVTYDILLTVGEESGMSTAEFFESGKDYNYGIEFDRGGTDVVMYQYDDEATRDLVRAAGARVGTGSFSDVAYLDHLGVKCFNWGVGYQDYHGPRAHAYLDDTFMMVAQYLTFHEANQDTALPHVEEHRGIAGGWGRGGGGFWPSDDDEQEWLDWCAERDRNPRDGMSILDGEVLDESPTLSSLLWADER